MQNHSPKTPDYVHFIGIGGVGMSGLANILLDLGCRVSGTDMERTLTTRRLHARGALVRCGHAAENLPSDTRLVVFSSAVPETNPERVEAIRRGIDCVRRGEFLARLAQHFSTVVAIGGSHGKTTTSAMLAHILRQCGQNPGYLVGADVPGWPVAAGAGNGDILVTEVDESDGTQAAMRSTIALITNIEDDHCWTLGGEQALKTCFANFANGAEHVLAWSGNGTREVLANHPDIRFLDTDAVPQALDLPMSGEHNRRNATMAIEAAQMLGVENAAALDALRTFPGVSRRMKTHYSDADGETVLIEDYAHHPTELRCLLDSLRERYPAHRLVAIFQPHRHERVKRYGNEFSTILGSADETVVTAPFAAWVDDGDDTEPTRIAEGVTDCPATYWDGEYAPLVDLLLAEQQRRTTEESGARTVYAIIGAGSVGKLVPILRDALIRRELTYFGARLREALPETGVSDEAPWWELTTLGVGGVRPLTVAPRSLDELRTVLALCRDWDIRPFILGHGSNLVGADVPSRTLVIRLISPAFQAIEAANDGIAAGAGASLPKFCRQLLDKGELPADWAPLAWIPGSLGGAVRMNAGADGIAMADIIRSVAGMTLDGADWQAKREEIDWSYRWSSVPDDVIITRVTLERPTTVDATAAQARYRETGEHRRLTQPRAPSAGCVFRNAGETSAGRLLDRCGHKGWRETGCAVSDRHANFIIRDGEVLETQLLDLVMRLRHAVFGATGILLEPEVRFVNPSSAQLLLDSIQPLRVAVLKGGPSAERDVSLRSGAAVADALRQAGMTVHEIDVTDYALPALPPGLDAVFPALHGTFGEDGDLQERLESRGVRYVGSGPAASHLTINKHATKRVLQAHNLRTPQSWVMSTSEAPMPAGIVFPVIVKPCNQGSSVGMTRLDEPDPAAWHAALACALAVDTEVLVEAFVPGGELTVGLLHGEPLPAIEIQPASGQLYDFDAKYEYRRGQTQYFCPPQHIGEETIAEAVRMAVETEHALGTRHLLRVDFRVDTEGRPWILEANTMPGFTATSLLPKAAGAAGITFPELCASLVRNATGE